jgi:hypothetical protein
MNHRRVNYRYLARLGDRLQSLGHSLQDWPTGLLLESCWQDHKDYCKSELGLAYCVRCKLPISDNEIDPSYADICTEHGETFRASIEMRQERSLARKLNHVPSSLYGPLKASLTRDIRTLKAAKPESPHVGVSKPEPSTIKSRAPGLLKFNKETDMPMDQIFGLLKDAKK